MSARMDTQARLLGLATSLLSLLLIVELYEIYRAHHSATFRYLLGEAAEVALLVGGTVLAANVLAERLGRRRTRENATSERPWRQLIRRAPSPQAVPIAEAYVAVRDEGSSSRMLDAELALLEAVFLANWTSESRRTHIQRMRLQFGHLTDGEFRRAAALLRARGLIRGDREWLSLTPAGQRELERRVFLAALPQILGEDAAGRFR